MGTVRRANINNNIQSDKDIYDLLEELQALNRTDKLAATLKNRETK